MSNDAVQTVRFDPREEGFNLFAPGLMDDPYPYYRALRDLDPVHHNPDIDYWFLSRYDDVAELGRDRTRLIRGSTLTALVQEYQGTAVHRLLGKNLFGLDEPDHGRLKGLIVSTFSRRRIDALRPRIEQICAELLDGAKLGPGGGTFALIPQLAYPLPFLVICELLGLPAGDRDPFLRWLRDLLPMIDPFPTPEAVSRAMRGATPFEEYLVGVIEERRRCLAAGRAMPPGLLSDLVRTAAQGDTLITDAELICLVFTVIGAGFENVTNLIGNAVRALAEHPDQARALRADPGLLANLPDEVLRYYTTTQYNARQAAVDVEVRGTTIPRGAIVVLLRGSANRDGRRFSEPDTFDLRRPDSAQHVGFGEGATFCTGAMLTRIEVQVAFAALLDRIGEFRITRWEQSPTRLFWGPAAVEVEYDPAESPTNVL